MDALMTDPGPYTTALHELLYNEAPTIREGQTVNEYRRARAGKRDVGILRHAIAWLIYQVRRTNA